MFKDLKYFVRDVNTDHYPEWTKIGYGYPPLNELLSVRGRRLSIWDNFIRIPKTSDYEQFICVVKGKERFRVVSPIYR